MFLYNVKVVRLILGAHASIRTPPPVVPIGCLPFGRFCAFSVVHLVLEARLSRMKNVIGCACSAREGTDPIKFCSFFFCITVVLFKPAVAVGAGRGRIQRSKVVIAHAEVGQMLLLLKPFRL